MKEATSVRKNLSQRTNSLGDSAVPSTVTSQSKSLDDFFGETIGKLMQEIPDGMNKDMLKLEIQNLIYKTKYLPPPPAHSVQSHATYPAHPLATYQAQTPAPSHQTRVPTASYMAQSPRPSHMAQQPGSSYMTQSPGTPQSGQPTRAGAVTPSRQNLASPESPGNFSQTGLNCINNDRNIYGSPAYQPNCFQ